MQPKVIAESRAFDGRQLRYGHHSDVLGCDMHFSVYLPPQAETKRVPLLYWLSGLTCTDENFVQKAGAQRGAAKHGFAIVAPDTSPRGEGVPDDPEEAYDFGLGAGFYVNATEAPWAAHYRMYDYCTEELPALIARNFPVDPARQGIFGHSMGGHGAITIALKNSDRFRSVSAFSPIASPINCPWGEKALRGYLGPDRTAWRRYDSCALIEDGATPPPLRVDQGRADNFLAEQLRPELLLAACEARGFPLTFRQHAGYDHSYFFIATFMDEQLAFHAEHLKPPD
jgi:S-formylglutathione hydrolase